MPISTLKRWRVDHNRVRVPDICDVNEGRGWTVLAQVLPSGHLVPPAHPNCNCWIELRG